jgi:tripartite ATP-independent transporter DctP family solute receptor
MSKEPARFATRWTTSRNFAPPINGNATTSRVANLERCSIMKNVALRAGMSRRRLFKLSAGAAALATFNIHTRRANAAEFVLKWGHDLPVIHPLIVRAKEAAERIKAESGGRLEVLVFPANQLGSDSDTLNQIRTGALEMANLPETIISTLIPVVAINTIGFAFKSYSDVWAAMDGALGAHIRAQMSKANIISIEKVWNTGFRQITTSGGPVKSPDDLKSFRIRVPVTPLWTSMFKSLGAAPTSINFNELYTALQTRVVDGQENPLSLILTAKLFEVQKYCSITNHLWSGQWTVLSRPAWERLPNDLREILSKNVNAAAVAERADVEKFDPDSRTELIGKGMIFNEPEIASFRDVLAKSGFYAEWKQKFGDEAWALLEKYSGKLA